MAHDIGFGPKVVELYQKIGDIVDPAENRDHTRDHASHALLSSLILTCFPEIIREDEEASNKAIMEIGGLLLAIRKGFLEDKIPTIN